MQTDKPKQVKVKKIITPDKTFKGLDEVTYHITPKEQIFCETWLETVNQTISALEAYDVKGKLLCEIPWSELSEKDKINRRKAEATAHTIGGQKLRKLAIKAYLDMRLADSGWIGKEVWKEHYKNIRQDDSLTAKNQAIDMYYKAKKVYGDEDNNYKQEIKDFFEGIKGIMKK